MSNRVYGPDEKAKLERLVKEGVSVLQEVSDLQTSLKDTIKSVAEELNVKPALINKAIKIAMKRDWSKHSDDFDELETIIATLGYDKDE
jgi:transposase-like protein